MRNRIKACLFVVFLVCVFGENLDAAKSGFTTGNYFPIGINAIGSRIAGASAITVAAWIQQDGTVVSSGSIASEVTSTTSSGAFLFQIAQNGTVMVPRINARSTAGDANQTVTATGATLASNVWIHLLAVVNYTSQNISIYTNGILAISSSVTFGSSTYVNSVNATQNACIGVFPTPSTPFPGTIAEVAIWRSALSNGEILSLAGKRTPLSLATLPVVYFPFYDQRAFGPISGIVSSPVGSPSNVPNPPIFRK